MVALLLLHKTPLVLLFLLLPGGCVQTFAYRELELPDKTFGEIWVGLQQATRQMGYAASRAETDRGKGVFQSTWETLLTGSTRTSARHRLRAEVERIGPEQAGWRVRCYVEKQRVGTIGRSVNPREEDWEPAGQDPYMERRFVGHLRAELGLEVIAPRRRSGKQPPGIR